MKFILTFTMAGIVLLSCTDSKENKVTKPSPTTTLTKDAPVKSSTDTQIMTRSVAQYYRVSANEDGKVECFPDIMKKRDLMYNLNEGQQVALVSGGKEKLLVNDIHWLHIYKDNNKRLPCYVQTQYLSPVPNN